MYFILFAIIALSSKELPFILFFNIFVLIELLMAFFFNVDVLLIIDCHYCCYISSSLELKDVSYILYIPGRFKIGTIAS
jgi:hypothetical protein